MYLNLIKVTLLRGCLQCPVPELSRIPLNCILEVYNGLEKSKYKMGRRIQMKLEEIKSGNWGSSFSVVTRRQDECPMNHALISGKGKIIFFFI